MSFIFNTDFFFSILRITAPIIFATLAAVISEKGGISNIGLEGTMMMSALFGSLFSYYSGSWIMGVLAAILTGMIVSVVMAFFSFNLETDIILSGTAVNLIGGGGTIFLVRIITGLTEGTQMTSTNSLISGKLQVPNIHIPIIKNIPVLGDILSGHSLLTYTAFLLVYLVWILLYKTPLGLKIRSVGENPDAAKSVGVSVIKMQYTVMILAGALSGLGGAYMSMSYARGFSQDMVAGRGFIALAAQAMGGGEPLGSMLSALVFGTAQALAVKASAIGVDSNLVSPIPYVVTIIGLMIFALNARKKEKVTNKEIKNTMEVIE